jgi:hypothetical protein
MKISGSYGIGASGGSALIGLEISGGSGTGIEAGQNTTIVGCYIHDMGGSGITFASDISGATIVGNLIDTCGAYGLLIDQGRGDNYGSVTVLRNSIYNCTNDGCRLTSNAQNTRVQHNIFANNGGYGMKWNGFTANQLSNLGVVMLNNAFYGNTSGAMSPSGLAALGVSEGEVTLTGDPFTGAASGDFSLNATSGAGAACRAAGFPSVFPGGLTSNFSDIGAAQHQDSGGGGGGTSGYSRSRVVNA